MNAWSNPYARCQISQSSISFIGVNNCWVHKVANGFFSSGGGGKWTQNGTCEKFNGCSRLKMSTNLVDCAMSSCGIGNFSNLIQCSRSRIFKTFFMASF